MYRLIEYKEEYRKQWNMFVDESEDGTPFHLIEWKEVLEESFGYKARYYMAMDDEGVISGIIPLITGRDLTFKKAGISMPFVNFLDICAICENVYNFIVEQMHSLLTGLKLDYIELRLKNGVIKDDMLGLHDKNYTFILPLDEDEEKVLSLSTGSNRNHVRKVYKNNWFSSSLEPEKLKEFYNIYTVTMKRLGSPAPSYKFFLNIMGKMKNSITLLTVSDNENGNIIGGMFLFTFSDTVYYQWGGCLTEYNRKYVNNFMYWEAVKFGIKNGYKYLDLGRSDFDSGTYKYKQQWGAEPVQLKYYRYSKNKNGLKPINKKDVGMFISLWKVMPDAITNEAGKFLIKYVMP